MVKNAIKQISTHCSEVLGYNIESNSIEGFFVVSVFFLYGKLLLVKLIVVLCTIYNT